MRCFRRSAVHVAVGAIALFAQAIMLPLAHSRHDVEGRRQGVAARAAAYPAVGAERVSLQAQRVAPAAHDQSACPLCATLARARTLVISAALALPAPATAALLAATPPARNPDRLARRGDNPRAPPLRSA
jgi:hypothetical protein